MRRLSPFMARLRLPILCGCGSLKTYDSTARLDKTILIYVGSLVDNDSFVTRLALDYRSLYLTARLSQNGHSMYLVGSLDGVDFFL